MDYMIFVYCSCGFTRTFCTNYQFIAFWWLDDVSLQIKPIVKAIPTIICWKIWKRINSIIYGDKMFGYRVIYEIN